MSLSAHYIYIKHRLIWTRFFASHQKTSGFTAGAVGGRLHSIARGWGGGVSVAAPCRQQWPAPREVVGGGAVGGGLHSTARGWVGGVSVAAPCRQQWQLPERLLEGWGVIELPSSMGTVRFVRFSRSDSGSTSFRVNWPDQIGSMIGSRSIWSGF